MLSALSSSRPFTMAETLSIASYRWGAIAYVWPAAASLGCVDLGAAAAAATAICGGRRRSRRVAVVAKRRRAAVLGAPDVATAAGAGPAVRRASRPGCGGPPAMTAGGPSGVGRGAGEGGEGEGEEDSPAGAGEGAGAAPSGAAYVPTQEDLPEGVGDELPTKLTLSQQLLLKQYIEQVQTMSEQQCKELTLEVVRQMMVKDNILKSMLNEKAAKQLKLDAPDPSDFMSGPGDAPSAGGGGGGKVPPGAPPPQGGVK